MDYDCRKSDLLKVFAVLDESEQKVIERLVDEVVFLEKQMEKLRALPFFEVHPRNKNRIRSTPAAKLYKECSQSYMNAVRIMTGLLRKVDTGAESELEKLLSEFVT